MEVDDDDDEEDDEDDDDEWVWCRAYKCVVLWSTVVRSKESLHRDYVEYRGFALSNCQSLASRVLNR